MGILLGLLEASRLRKQQAAEDAERRKHVAQFESMRAGLPNCLLRTGLNELERACERMPPEQVEKLVSVSANMMNTLRTSNSASERAQGIRNFSRGCAGILQPMPNGSLRTKLLRAAIVVLAGICVAAITGVIGGLIGAGAGAWSGPGVFFTALAGAGCGASVAVCAVACALGLITSAGLGWWFFKPPKPHCGVQYITEGARSEQTLQDLKGSFISPEL